MKPDIQLKKFFEHDDRFLSLFNAYFYHGESVLKEEYLSPDDSEVVKLVASNHIDVIRRYKENEYFALFVLENQSKVDYGAAYSITKDEQLKLILKQEEGDVKVCEAMRELFEDATNKGIALGETKAFMASINSIMIKFNLNADQAMDALSIDEKDRDFYREKLASLSKS